MNQTLKELLLSPFKTCMKHGNYCVELTCNSSEAYIDLIHIDLIVPFNNKTSRTKQKEIMKWVAAAINEKYVRDFAEPMKWKSEGSRENHNEYFVCPVCEYGLDFESNYCPNCGQRLMPPEEII